MKTLNYVIRSIIENDLEQIASLYTLFWSDTMNIPKLQEVYARTKNSPQYIFLCAEIDGEIVGTIQGIICEELYGECKPFMVMENFVVKPAYRSMGIGRSLLNKLESLGKDNQCTQIIFITEADRNDTIAFYEKLGFNSSSHKGFKRSLK